VHDFSKQRFDKLPNLIPGNGGTETTAGKLPAYDVAWEKVRISKPKKLAPFKGFMPQERTVDDPIMQRLAMEEKAQIFATDVAAAALMTASKAMYPWDLVVSKLGNLFFVDKREEENMLDHQTVSETASMEFQPLDEDGVNGVRQLMKEAMKTANDYQFNMQDKTKFRKLEEDDPFAESPDQVICNQGYYYNIFKLNKETKICIRCSVHSYLETTGELLNTYILPEWNEKRQNWGKDLDISTAVCLTKEITDNSTKFCRWTVMSHLAGCDKMRFAFCQRTDPKSSEHHRVVGTFTTDTVAFAKQLNLNIDNCWAIMKDVLETLQDRDEEAAEYLFVKDLN
jgi:translation initiation factor 3 subunit D